MTDWNEDFILDAADGVVQALEDNDAYSLSAFIKDGRKQIAVSIFTFQGESGSITVMAERIGRTWERNRDATLTVQYQHDYTQYQAWVWVLGQHEDDWLFRMNVDEEQPLLVGHRFHWMSSSESLFVIPYDEMEANPHTHGLIAKVLDGDKLIKMIEKERKSAGRPELTATARLAIIQNAGA